MESGWIEPWNQGNFATIRCADEMDKPHMIFENEKERCVGYPKMNSICENLLRSKSEQQSTLDVMTQTHAIATHASYHQEQQHDSKMEDSFDKRMWRLYRHPSKEILGNDFDWLIATDRLSITQNGRLEEKQDH